MNVIKKIKRWIGSRRSVRMHLEQRIADGRYYPMKSDLGYCGANTFIEYPVYFDSPKDVFLEEDVKIRNIARFVNSPSEKITVRKYTVVGPDCMIVTNNHRKTVGVPQFLLGTSHINDRSTDVTVGEDVWIGARVTILAGASIGRGSIVGACSLVGKPLPPYSVAVGSPARIIGKVFEREDILRHEAQLYSEEDRLSREDIDRIFSQYGYDSLKTYGCNTPLGQKEMDAIDNQKRVWNFIGK